MSTSHQSLKFIQQYSPFKGTDTHLEDVLRKPLSRNIVVDFIAGLEALLIVLSALVAKLLYVDIFHAGAEPEFVYMGVGWTGALLSFFVMQHRGHYDLDVIISRPLQSYRIFRALLFSFFLLLAVAFMLKVVNDYSRAWLISWFILSFVSVATARKLSVSFLNALSQKGLFNERVAIIGIDPLTRQISGHIKENEVEAKIVETFTVSKTDNSHHFMHRSLTDQLHKLVAFAKTTPVDRVIVALPTNGGPRVQEILLELGQLTAHVDFCPGEVALGMKRPQISYLGELGLYNLQKTPIGEWGTVAKRLMDLAIVIPALILAGIPMLIIAAAIRLTSPGKILFIQDRHGLNGKIIKVMKFRTMTEKNRDDKVHQVKKGDMDVTPVGRFLRRWSLDELPQLLNVLKGEMSMVGSRPHPIKLDEKFADVVQLSKDFEKLDRYAARYKVKPGITGWAQVNGSRGETDTRQKMEKRVGLDLHYINNWSIWLDMKILLMTVTAVLKGENAH